MGWFDAVSDFVSNTVNSVAQVVSDVGKATGLEGVAKSLNLAGTGSNAAEVAAIAAAVTAGYYYSAPAAAGDLAAYNAAAASTSTAWELPAGSIVDGVAIEGGMSIPANSVYSGMTMANGTQVVQTVGASGLESILTNSATAGWAATTTEALKTAKDAVSVMQIVNRATGQKSIVSASAPIPTGWEKDTSFDPSQYQKNATQGPFMQLSAEPSYQQPGGLIVILAMGAALVYFGRKTK